MATNQTGIAIIIKAWLPVSGPISEQITKLQMVEAAHSTGDYAELLKAASVEDIKTEQKTRRVEDAPTTIQDLARVTGADQPNEILNDLPMVDVADDTPAAAEPRKRKQTADAA